MSPFRLMVVGAATVLTLSGCGGAAASAPSRTRDVISREELGADGIASLMVYDAIQRLRPNWLASRGATSVTNSVSQFPGVLMNNAVRNDIDVLRTLPVSDVEMVRFMDARDATTRFGTGHVNGLIEIVTRRGQ